MMRRLFLTASILIASVPAWGQQSSLSPEVIIGRLTTQVFELQERNAQAGQMLVAHDKAWKDAFDAWWAVRGKIPVEAPK